MNFLFKSYLLFSWIVIGVSLKWPFLLKKKFFVVGIIGIVSVYTLAWAWHTWFKRASNETDLLDISEEVSFKSQQLIWLIQENEASIEEIMEIFRECAASMQDNAASVQEVSAGIDEISNSSKEINKKAKEIEDLCQQTLDSSKENKSWIEKAGDTLLEIANTISDSKESMEDLESVAQDVDQLLQKIKEITKQINLLALNASIEAARAGQSGDGFNVVAEEIKALSDETDSLTEKIQETLDQFKSELSQNAQIVEKGANKIANIEEVSSQSVEGFEQIINNLQKINDFMDNLSENTACQAQATEQSSTAIDSIAEQTMNVSSQIETMQEKVENQYENTVDILDYSGNLNEVGYELHKESINEKDDNTIVFGVNPFTQPEKVKELYVPIIQEVVENINKNAKVVIVNNYQELSKYIKQGLVDAGWFSPMAYVEAKNQSNIKPMITPLINGKPSYKGYIFTKKSSKYQNLKDVRNASFGFVDPLSASGYIYPKNLLKEANIDVENDLDTNFLGAHNKVIDGVLKDRVQVGATYNEAWERAKKQGKSMEKLQIIKKTNSIPKDVIAAKSNLSKKLTKKLKEAFINLSNDTHAQRKMDPANIDGFTESDDENYDIIRKYKKD